MEQESALSVSEARDLTDRIKVGMEEVWELIKEAYTSRVWVSLGYSSWDDYCDREFESSRVKLPREERQEVVSSMREIGMSTRAIAAATGAGYGTIQRELAGDPNGSPESEPAPVVGTDGKTYTPKPTPKPAPEDETPQPEWEDVGTIPQSRLNNITPPRPAPGFDEGDLEELNTPKPTQPPNTGDLEEQENITKIMIELRKAAKAIKEATHLAQHLDLWDGGPLSGDLRDLLDELDSTLASGGFNAELAKLLEGEN